MINAATSEHLSIITWNVQTLYEKGAFGNDHCKLKNSEVRRILDGYDIVCLIETHIDRIPDEDILPGYKVFHSFRSRKHHRARRISGGMAVAVRNNLFKGITRVHSSSDDTIWLKLDKKFFNMSKDIYLGAVYLVPEGSSYLNWTNVDPFSLLEFDISRYREMGQILLTGDFNSRTSDLKDYIESELDSSDSLPLPRNYKSDTFDTERINNMDKMVNNYGKQLIDLCIASDIIILNGRTMGDILGKFTCYEYNGQSAVDYHVVSKSLFKDIIAMRVHNLMEYSDHTPISLILNVFGSRQVNQLRDRNNKYESVSPVFKWDEDSKEKYLYAFSQPDVQNNIIEVLNMKSEIISQGYVDNMVCHINNIYIEVAKKSLSLKRSNRKNVHLHQPWYTKNCLSIKNNLLCIKKLRQKYPHNREIREDYNAVQRLYRQKIRKNKREYRNSMSTKMFEAIKTKKFTEFWKIFNSTKRQKFQGNKIGTDIWLNHFKSLNAEPQLDEVDRRNMHEMTTGVQSQAKNISVLDQEITDIEIYEAIKKSKNKKSPGVDRITNEMIKLTKNFMVPVLKKAFNVILNSGYFPGEWKKGIIVPIHKSGSENDPNNYRGITLTSALGKLLTSILNKRLRSFSDTNCLISDLQFGGRENRRTTDALYILKSAIEWHKSKAVPLYAAFVDFQKAFDMVWHDALIFKLLKMGIGGKFIKVIMDIYSNISSCVKVGDKRTTFFSCLKGVRQGDGLSSTLYNLYINDIVNEMKTDDSDPFKIGDIEIGVLLYADDMVILSSSMNGLQNSLNKLSSYSKKWKLKINTSKSKVIQFNKRKFETFTFNGEEIMTVKQIKYLGLVISNSGKFSCAISTLCKQANKSLWPLYGMFGSFGIDNVRSKILLFDSLIKPILIYGSEIWCSDILSENSIANIFNIKSKFYETERVQLKFLKRALNVPTSTSNLAVWSEVGKYPIAFDVLRQYMSYFARLESLPDTTVVYKLHKFLASDSATYAYGNTPKLLFQEINLPVPNNLQAKTTRKKLLHAIKTYLIDYVDNVWYNLLSDNTSKLKNYKLIKHSFQYESYLDTVKDSAKRIRMTKLRLSCHDLEIERGRYKSKRIEERLCSNCALGKIEDEIHFLLECPKYTNERNEIMSFLETVYPWTSQSQNHKSVFITMMSSTNFEVQRRVSEYILEISKIRN